MSGSLGTFPSKITFPLHWGEMDAFGHINNVSYFRYFESGRLDYFHLVGIDKYMAQHGQGPILAHTDCRFRQPMVWPATVCVATKVDDVGTDRFSMSYALVREDAPETLVATGTGKIVWYDYAKATKAPLPAVIAEAIASLEGR